MNDKVLTLIIPSYNMEKYLDRCLSSLVVGKEQMGLFEALIINDGSTDRTSGIGHSYESSYPDSFRVIDKENGHYGSCVNRGLAEAKGTFVKVLDADDAFDTDVFSSFLAFLAQDGIKEKADLILSDYSVVDEDGRLQHIHRYADYTDPFSIGQITWQDRENWFIHGLTYRTSLLHDMDYRQTEGISYTDEEWITKPLALVNACYRFNGTLYRYTVGREGQSMSPAVYAKSLGMRLAVAKSVLSFYSSLDKGTPVSAFVKGRLTSLLNHIYHTTLFSKKTNKEALEALRSFDGQLASDEAGIHAALDRPVTIAGLHFRPVRVFREEKSCRLSVIRGLYATTNALNNLRQTQ